MGIKNEELNQFKKGQSGNPAGRPKGSLNRATIAKKWLTFNEDAKNPITGEDESMSQEDIMTLALIKKARRGDTTAYARLMDSAYGAPVQQIDQTVNDVTPPKIEYYDPKEGEQPEDFNIDGA